MAIYLTTPDPRKLLTDFKDKIQQGHIVTWSYDANGDFTHTPAQWAKKAWLRPRLLQGQLALGIVKPNGASVTWPIYGVFHGRFIESMVEHCHDLFSSVQATPKPVGQLDQV
ncbi:hypothetical protein [Acidibrevibacterium fodinaquatile]|uniref:hypothetical protein n=1 Tax=Acidibrevibacterium fodinaquatile TaxID=1969806 RepID=UPI000E0CFE7A|nr:hypothetical protein [Acidibrevibacterium fodinaquatile]